MFRKTLLASLAWLLILGWPGASRAASPVRVGGYEFAPFVTILPDGRATGVTPELLDLLNRSQDRYRFELVLTSPSRRYQDFVAGKFDMIFFENPSWGWKKQDLPVEASRQFLAGGEVYIARAEPGRGQSFFADLTTKRMVGILGYHYGFAGYEADPDILRQKFRMILVNSNDASIEMILKGRGDAAVITYSFLMQYLHRHPEDRSRLLISDKFDQVYSHRVLVRRGFSPDAVEMDRLLDQLARSGALRRLFASHGLER